LRVRTYQRRRHTVRGLSNFSDRELEYLDLSRYDIVASIAL